MPRPPVSPPALRHGDTVGIVSTARKVSAQELAFAYKLLNSRGYLVRPGRHLYDIWHQFAGSDAQRAADLQEMINDQGVKAILFARGGYGTARVIDQIDFSPLYERPKWLIGFSDLTVLLAAANLKGLEAIHGMMALSLQSEAVPACIDCTLGILAGQVPSYPLLEPDALNRPGQGMGRLCGGNLSLLTSLVGTPTEPVYDRSILFIEEVDEYLYHIDRMMGHLKRAGRLAKLAGLVVGSFSQTKDNPVPFGRTAYEIVAEAVAEYNYPVAFGFPAGHQSLNYPLIMGRPARLTVLPTGAKLAY